MAAGAFALLAVALVLAVVGLVDVERGSAAQRALAERSALDLAEARAAKRRTRFDIWVRRQEWGQRLEDAIAAGGTWIRPGDLVLLTTAACLLVYVVVNSLAGPLFGVATAVGVVLLLRAQLQRRAQARRDEFIAQLPELARTLSNAAGAGLALRSAIGMAADELPAPAGTEMQVIRDRLAVGESLDAALAALERRLPSRELKLLVTTLIIQSRAGGALVSSLRGISETLDARKDLRRELRTLTAGAVYTGYLIGIVGVGVLLLVNVVSPGALKAMSGSLLGQISFVIAGGLFALGLFLIRRTTDIEV